MLVFKKSDGKPVHVRYRNENSLHLRESYRIIDEKQEVVGWHVEMPRENDTKQKKCERK